MRLKNIRASHLRHFLLLPLLLCLVNMQNNYCRVQALLFGLDSLSLMYISYCVGILCVLFSKSRRWLAVSRAFAVISVISIIARLFMPNQEAELACLVICWMGLGGCVAYAINLFVFSLNNTERLFGALLTTLSHGVFMCLLGFGVNNAFLTSVLPVLLTVSAAACIFGVKPLEAYFPAERRKPVHPSVWLSTVFFVLLFILDSASSFVFTAQSAAAQHINGAGVLAAIVLSVVIQVVYKQSVWHMWNLFFIFSFLCHLLLIVSDSGIVHSIAAFLHGILYVGYVAIFYTIGGIYKKHGNTSLMRQNLLIIFGVLALALTALGFLEKSRPQAVSIFIVIGSAVLFFVFVLMAPLFERHFFGAEWVEDFHKSDMIGEREAGEKDDLFANRRISPREREVAELLLKGLTMRQISAELGIAESTVNGYCGTLYKKLGINSRVELFVQYGAANSGQAAATGVKK